MQVWIQAFSVLFTLAGDSDGPVVRVSFCSAGGESIVKFVQKKSGSVFGVALQNAFKRDAVELFLDSV